MNSNMSLTNLFPGAISNVLDFLPKRDFTAAALISSDWRRTVFVKARRHPMKPGAFVVHPLCRREATDGSPSVGFQARLIVSSTATHVTSVRVRMKVEDVEVPQELSVPRGRHSRYSVEISPSYAVMDRATSWDNARHVFMPLSRIDGEQFLGENNIPGDGTLAVPVNCGDGSLDPDQLLRALMTERCWELHVRDPALTVDQIMISVERFLLVGTGLHRRIIRCRVQDFPKVCRAMRSIDNHFRSPRHAGWIKPYVGPEPGTEHSFGAEDGDEYCDYLADRAEYHQENEKIYAALGEIVVASQWDPPAPLFSWKRKAKRWTPTHEQIPGSRARRIIHRQRGQALKWFTRAYRKTFFPECYFADLLIKL
jgi:hypothetical protein